jgi:sugar lactone lactonase YvrE
VAKPEARGGPGPPLHPRESFRELARPLQHPEALCWDPLTERIYCGGEGGQLYAVTLGGDIAEVANTGGSILGMAVDGAGIVYACDWHRDEVVRIDPATGAWSTYTAGAPDLPIDDPNSPVFAEDGTMYVTGSENPAIFRVAPGGATEVWSRAAPGYPNGVTLTPEGDALIVAESHPEDHEGGRVWRIPIEADGGAGEATVLAELWHTVPDGVAFDVDGNLYVAHYTPDRIDRIAPDGRVDVLVEDWEAVHLNAPTNIAFAGPDLSLLVAACVGEEFLAIADLGIRGQPLRRPIMGG